VTNALAFYSKVQKMHNRHFAGRSSTVVKHKPHYPEVKSLGQFWHREREKDAHIDKGQN